MTSEAARIKWDWNETANAIEELLGEPVGRINIPLAITSHLAILKSERDKARASGFSAAKEKAELIVLNRGGKDKEMLAAAIRALGDET